MLKTCILIGIISLFFGCEKKDIQKEIPECIQEKIDEIANEEVWNPPAKIYEYQYNGETVYYIPPRCCDIQSILYDENCNVICHPDGGISGDGDGQCTDFFSLRKNERLIWEDLRD